jgi:hypothetical protein
LLLKVCLEFRLLQQKLTRKILVAFLNGCATIIKELGKASSTTTDDAFSFRVTLAGCLQTQIIRTGVWDTHSDWAIRKSCKIPQTKSFF